MSPIGLKDILISARQESHRMRHYYLGVEHIFIALLEVKGGIASDILESYGLQPSYVVDAIRRKVGKGSKQRLWAGTPNTPRADIIIDIAHEIALENGRNAINERDLLIAILDEGENIPTHVLKVLGLDLDTLKDEVKTRKPNQSTTHTFVNIEINPDAQVALTKDQSYILRRMFHGFARIYVDQQLKGGYTPSSLFVVTPIQADDRRNSTVVVKLGPTDIILDEAHRYERYVKSKLPALTARLEDTPTAPEASELAGIKYGFIAGADETPHNLRSIISTWQPKEVGDWIRKNIYEVFGKTWWQQTTPYRFDVWREYDWLLPPMLTLDYVPKDKVPDRIVSIKPPIKRSNLKPLEPGEIVSIENFIVQKVNKDDKTIQLAVLHSTDTTHAYKVKVRQIDLKQSVHYRGEILDQVVGRVWQTRDQRLMQAVRELTPDFDVQTNTLSHQGTTLPNPIFAYRDLMEMTIEGSMCTLHGDLHLGNILIGPSNNGLLIDFALTHDGHTIFDWATLEISLLADYILPRVNADSWDKIWQVARYIQAVNLENELPQQDTTLTKSFVVIQDIRNIVRECLIHKENWSEYYVALALASLRAMTWDTMHEAGRRLMYLASGLAIQAMQDRKQEVQDNDITMNDTTDQITNF